MASARLERTTVELIEGTGQHALRATGQVVLFPGYLALYEEGKDEAGEDEGRLPRMKSGDSPAKKGVRADQHFTQPPPRYSEATLVKKMEELGIGRPSDLCVDPSDPEGSRLRLDRQEPLYAERKRAAGHGLPRTLFRTLRQL